MDARLAGPASRRAAELWNRRPEPAAAPEIPDRPQRIPDAWAQPPAPSPTPAEAAPATDEARSGGDPGGRRSDPWDRPTQQGRPDDWAAADEPPAAGGWDTVLPPVGGAPRVPERGSAGVEEATTFLSQWGPPPLRSAEDRDTGQPGWGRPSAPSRAGAGRSADNPVPPPRPGPSWSRPGGPSAALPPVSDAPSAQPAEPQLPAAPTEPAAERWIAEQLAADRSAATGAEPTAADDRFAGYWTTDRPAKRAPGRPADDLAGRPTPAPGPASADSTARPGRASDDPTGRPGRASDDPTGRPGRASDDPTGRPGSGQAATGPSGRLDSDPRPATNEPSGRTASRAPGRTGAEEPTGQAANRSPGSPVGIGTRPPTGQRGADTRPPAGQRAADTRPPTGQQAADTRPPAERAEDAALSGWSAGRPGTDERFAGYWAREPAEPVGQPQRGSRDEPTEVIGPFDVGAWSRDGTASPANPRGRQRQAERPEPTREHPDDRAGAGPGGGGRSGGEPPNRAGSPERRRRSFGDRIRTFLRGIGQTFITLAVILLLLAAYEVWFTDLMNHRTQKNLTTALQKRWDAGDDPTVGAAPARPGEKVRSIPLGDGFALIYIPDFGTDYVYTVVEGTGLDQLDEGPGHYVDTPLPGAVGNVAIAGHRVGKGSPFLNLDKLKAGSAIVIRTKSYWYTYRVVGEPGGNADAVSTLGFPGREIVDPTDVGVIAPVPDRPGAKPTRRLLTLTTCHPKFSARQRMVIHAELDGAPFPVGQGSPPSMTGA